MMKNTQTNSCPICRSFVNVHVQVDGYEVLRCSRCAHQFANTQPSQSHVAEQFGDNYFLGGETSGYDDYLSNKLIIQAHASRYAEIVAKHLTPTQQFPDRKMLDIGCAAGFVMQGFQYHGWEATGLDPNEMMVNYAKRNDLRAYQATLESVFDPSCELAPPEEFDLVSLIQVVAHLTDISVATQNLKRLVRPSGFVLVETWDSRSVTARILGKRWHEYSPPNVLHYFSTDSLDHLLGQADFEFVAGGRPEKRINMGHGRSIFNYKYGHTPWGKACLFASRLLSDDFAVRYPSEDLFWRLYKKSDPDAAVTRRQT